MKGKANKKKQTVTFRLDEDLVAKIKSAAKDDCRTLNSWIEYWLIQKMSGNNPVMDRASRPEPPAGLKGIDLTIWKKENWK